MEPNVSYQIACDKERKWFMRTLIASAFSVLFFGAFGGTVLWGRSVGVKSQAALHSPIPISDAQLDQIHYQVSTVFVLGTATVGLLFLSGLLFFGFLIRWFFALQARRKAAALFS